MEKKIWRTGFHTISMKIRHKRFTLHQSIFSSQKGEGMTAVNVEDDGFRNSKHRNTEQKETNPSKDAEGLRFSV